MEEYMEMLELQEMAEQTERLQEIQERMEQMDQYEISRGKAIEGGYHDMAEYYKDKMTELEKMNSEISFCGDISESGWRDRAAKELAKHGGKETRYYNYCMEEAAKKQIESKR